jgi:hypothetical protein
MPGRARLPSTGRESVITAESVTRVREDGSRPPERGAETAADFPPSRT